MSNNNNRILSQPISYQELLSIKDLKITGIYKIENLINHKVYIGKSKNIIERLKDHIKNEQNSHLRSSFEKYGFNNFSFEVIKQTYDLNYWEIFLIQIYRATNDRYGYNIATGGEGGNLGPKVNKRISEGVRNSEKYRLSRQNPEFRKRMSEINKGVVFSQERRDKISKSHLGKKMPEEYCIRMRQNMKGRKLSEEWKHRISEGNKGKTKDYIIGSIWWNDGKKNYRSKECPFEGCVKGRLDFNNIGSTGMKWWTNDIVEVLSKECPEGFHRGKLPMKQETKDKLSKINIEKHKRS